MKRQLSLVLALVMILGTFSTVFAADTVATVDAVKEASDFLAKEKVLVGDEKGDLMLNKNLLRQDTVVLVAKLMGEYDVAEDFPTAEGIPTYEDVRDPFYLPLLAWAQANETFVGQSKTEFGFGDNISAQEYAKVLLVALDYSVSPNGDSDVTWDKALEKAEDLGILENVKVEKADKLVRGDMAVMTFNALGTKMKDADKTLAEELGIKMPEAAKPTELTAKVNDTVNLKEVVVELSNAKLVDKEKLEDENNYRVEKFDIKTATVDGDNVILLIEDGKNLVKDRKYDLIIRGVDRAIDKTYTFRAYDNESPKVEKVEVLGEYGIKVTASEPVRDPQERNFLIDGKNIAMNIEQYGREIILTPYYNSSFPSNAKTLTIKELEDFENYKSAREEFDIEVVNDEVAPKVTDVTYDKNVVTVTFDKDIYKKSVNGYISAREEGNVYYQSGRQDIFTQQDADADIDHKYAEKVETNKVKYTFEDELPRRTEVTIVDVQNHSKVAMERTTMLAREKKDNLEPVITETDVSEKFYEDEYTAEEIKEKGFKNDGYAVIELEFDKDLDRDSIVTKDLKLENNRNFKLYREKVLDRYEANDGEVLTEVYFGDKDLKDTNKKVFLRIDNIKKLDDDKRYEYILEVKNIEDSKGNKMYTDYVDFDLDKDEDFEVKSVYVDYNSRKDETEIRIDFTESVDRRRAEGLENYLFRKGDKLDVSKKVYDLGDKDLDGSVIVENDGKRVTLVLPEFNPEDEDYNFLELSRTLRDKDNNRLSGERFFDISAANISYDRELVKVVGKANDIKEENYTKESYKALEDAKALPEVTQRQIDDKIKAIEKAIKDLKLVEEDKEATELKEAKVAKLAEIKAVALTEEEKADKTEESVVAAEAKLEELKNAAKDLVEAAKNKEDVAVVKVDKTDALALLEIEELEEGELSGEFVKGMYGEFLEIQVTKDANIEKVTVDGKDVAFGDINPDNGKFRITPEVEKGAKVEVTIDEVVNKVVVK